MIEELVNDGKNESNNKQSDDPYIPKDTFTRPSYMIGCPTIISDNNPIRVLRRDIRLPWIHKSDPLDFHPLNVLPSVNHVELPLR